MNNTTLACLTALLSLCGPVAAAQTPPAVTIEYYHLDGIGSVRAVTNDAGQVIRRHDYHPFGEGNPTQAGSDPLRFSAKERDAETGLDYLGARYYASRTGRFTTVDPVLDIEQALVDPQRWNRYSYALNRPYRYVDPDGANPVLIKLLELAQRAASSPAAQRAQQVVATQGSRAWVGLTRLFNTPEGQELLQTGAELLTGAELGPAATFKSELAERIGRGHAVLKHVFDKQDLVPVGVKSADDLVHLTFDILNRYSPSNLKFLSKGRVAIWDDVTETVLIYDPHNKDLGTIFRPDAGKKYWEGLQ